VRGVELEGEKSGYESPRSLLLGEEGGGLYRGGTYGNLRGGFRKRGGRKVGLGIRHTRFHQTLTSFSTELKRRTPIEDSVQEKAGRVRIYKGDFSIKNEIFTRKEGKDSLAARAVGRKVKASTEEDSDGAKTASK